MAFCVTAVGLARRRSASELNDAGLQGRTKGGPQARVLLTEFSDFQCPSCKYARPIIEALLKQYADQVRFVFRHYPLSQHAWARPAAVAAECAARQGRFWPVHDRLFEEQEKWVESGDPPAKFEEYAKAAGVDLQAFKSCQADPAVAAAVERDVAEGNAWQVMSTPTLFIGHRRLAGAKQIQLYGAGLIEKQLK